MTPGTRAANNGNWRTASRWASMLRGSCRVILQSEWRGEPVDALIALHARRSADSIARFAAARGAGPLAVVLTGTDLYRDLPHDLDARASLDAASRLVVLQDAALAALEPAWRRKAEVIYQSSRALAPLAGKPRDRLDVVAVGHLREEKDPRTLFAAVRALPAEAHLRITHIGAPLDPALAREARALARGEPRYRYLGPLPHGLARQAMRRAHLLAHPSIMEGGANVIVEAITAGSAVLASRMDGNVGMLGPRYPGYFPVGDASALASRLVQACEDLAWRRALLQACRQRAPLFRPEREARAVRTLAAGLMSGGR